MQLKLKACSRPNLTPISTVLTRMCSCVSPYAEGARTRVVPRQKLHDDRLYVVDVWECSADIQPFHAFSCSLQSHQGCLWRQHRCWQWLHRSLSPACVSMLLQASHQCDMCANRRAAFARFEDAKMSSPEKAKLMTAKITYIAMNMLAMSGGIYKMSLMGLLPNTPSDWVSYVAVPPNVQFSSGSQA